MVINNKNLGDLGGTTGSPPGRRLGGYVLRFTPSSVVDHQCKQ
jgi:hypothetical protein